MSRILHSHHYVRAGSFKVLFISCPSECVAGINHIFELPRACPDSSGFNSWTLQKIDPALAAPSADEFWYSIRLIPTESGRNSF